MLQLEVSVVPRSLIHLVKCGAIEMFWPNDNVFVIVLHQFGIIPFPFQRIFQLLEASI